MAALTTLNITEKNANNSLSVTVKVNVTKEGVFTTTLSKEDVDKIHSYGIKLPTNRLGNEGYFNSIALSDLESQIREVWNDLVRIRVIKPKKFLGFFRQLTGITIEGAFNGCSACVEIMTDDDNGVSMMHYIDYEDIIGVELIKN